MARRPLRTHLFVHLQIALRFTHALAARRAEHGVLDDGCDEKHDARADRNARAERERPGRKQAVADDRNGGHRLGDRDGGPCRCGLLRLIETGFPIAVKVEGRPVVLLAQIRAAGIGGHDFEPISSRNDR